ncbi:hypothetical protein BDW66DRAFT_128000 [Aspergillus desertorum]
MPRLHLVCLFPLSLVLWGTGCQTGFRIVPEKGPKVHIATQSAVLLRSNSSKLHRAKR